jgi:hypothetical protein
MTPCRFSLDSPPCRLWLPVDLIELHHQCCAEKEVAVAAVGWDAPASRRRLSTTLDEAMIGAMRLGMGSGVQWLCENDAEVAVYERLSSST